MSGRIRGKLVSEPGITLAHDLSLNTVRGRCLAGTTAPPGLEARAASTSQPSLSREEGEEELGTGLLLQHNGWNPRPLME